MKKINWKIAGILITILVILSIIIFSTGKEEAKAITKETAVTAQAVQSIKKMPTLSLTGTIEGQTSAAIAPKINGRIESVYIEDGQYVEVGQALLKLESTELENQVKAAEDTMRKAKANFDNVKADYERYRTLYEQSAVSKQTLDSYETKLKVAEADYSTTEANLENAKKQLEYATITAPVSGMIANKMATIGQIVNAGTTLLQVEKIDQVYAVTSIEQKDIGVIKPGMAARVKVDAFEGEVFEGALKVINPAAGNNSRMFKTKILVENLESRLKPGMFVKVEIITGEEAGVIAVPQSAVTQKQGLYYVFTVEEGKVTRHQVEIGELMGDVIEIKAGLEEGSVVATSNVSKLKDGELIKVVTK